jgi:hypothetical protein
MLMKNQALLKSSTRVKVLQVNDDLTRGLRARGFRHCGTDLRPFDPAPSCRFCGGDCDGLH